MTNKPKVTVIVPVYNIEGFIKRAADSIIKQTLTDWEMFLVDDGSTDESGKICDDIAESDARIKVIHQENQGAAAARNAAIDKANGKFIYFMDGDDWTVPEMLEDMVRLAENYTFDSWAGKPQNNNSRGLILINDIPDEYCAQLVITGFYIETYYSGNEFYIQKQSVEPVTYASKNEFRCHAHELFDKNLLYTPWNKLYLASYIKNNNIYFPKVHWDDFPFNLDIVRHVERVTVSDKAYYHFQRQRAESESEKYNIGLYAKREEENQWLVDLYDGWRAEQQLEILKAKSIDSVQPETGEQTVKVTEAAAVDAADCANAVDSMESTDANNAENKENAVESADSIEIKKDVAETVSEVSTAENTEVANEIECFNFLRTNSVRVPAVNIPSPEAQEFIARRYLERIIGCVENVTNPACRLSFSEKHGEIERIINRDTVRMALKIARPGSLYMKVMLIPIRFRAVSLTYLEGKTISKIKSKNTKLFAKLKANR